MTQVTLCPSCLAPLSHFLFSHPSRYYKKKAYTQALSLLKESAEALASNPVVRYYLGMAYYKNGHKALASTKLQQALGLKQDLLVYVGRSSSPPLTPPW